MRKYIKTFIKQEKRLVKLIIEKGLLFNDINPNELYWAEFRHGKYHRKYKSKAKYRKWDYLPEIHYATCDYWGEGDEHSLVSHIKEGLYWANVITEPIPDEAFPESTFKNKSRKALIRYLKTLKTTVKVNGINKLLIRKDF